MRSRSRSFGVAAALAFVAAAVFAAVGLEPAKALPSYRSDCTSCHTAAAAGVSAAPDTLTPAAGAKYSVAVVIDLATTGWTGYWIADSDAAGAVGRGGGTTGGPGSQAQWTATMTAPATPGTYYYKVFGARGYRGQAAAALYSITVPAVPVPPPLPGPTPTPTPDPVPTPTPDPRKARIVRVTPSKAVAGKRIAVVGHDFGADGVVRFGSRRAKVVSWKAGLVVCRVPRVAPRTRTVRLVVIPLGGERSNVVKFTVKAR
jgi:hypothetical protein